MGLRAGSRNMRAGSGDMPGDGGWTSSKGGRTPAAPASGSGSGSGSSTSAGTSWPPPRPARRTVCTDAQRHPAGGTVTLDPAESAPGPLRVRPASGRGGLARHGPAQAGRTGAPVMAVGLAGTASSPQVAPAQTDRWSAAALAPDRAAYAGDRSAPRRMASPPGRRGLDVASRIAARSG